MNIQFPPLWLCLDVEVDLAVDSRDYIGYVIVSRKCSLLNHFLLCIIDPKTIDHMTNQPLDEGFGEMVQHC